MHIHVLGCHGADQLVGGTAGLVRQESCGFLIDGSVLLDAGTIGTRLTLAEQRRIRFVLLSHLHFDHIKSLPTLVDNLAEKFDEPVIVAATEPVVQGLKDHVFNDKVYPNFFALPNRKRPISDRTASPPARTPGRPRPGLSQRRIRDAAEALMNNAGQVKSWKHGGEATL